MTQPLLATRGLVKRFGGLMATDQIDFAVAARRNPRHHRTERRRQDDAGQPDHRRAAAGRRRDPARRRTSLGCTDRDRAARSRALVPSRRLFGNMSLLENLLVPYLAHSADTAPWRGRRARHGFLELAQLDRLADEPAKSLSGGQRVLLQVAAGFMCPNLRLYVLDEPFAGINPVIKDTIST